MNLYRSLGWRLCKLHPDIDIAYAARGVVVTVVLEEATTGRMKQKKGGNYVGQERGLEFALSVSMHLDALSITSGGTIEGSDEETVCILQNLKNDAAFQKE
jgi:hypothetical protein